VVLIRRLRYGAGFMHSKCMGKTITIDDEAYAILKSHKSGKESFSEVIKKEMSLAGYLQELEDIIKATKAKAQANKRKKNGTSR